MSQATLAKATGLHRNTIRRLYYNNWQRISQTTLDRICTALQVGIDELLVWVEERDQDSPRQQ